MQHSGGAAEVMVAPTPVSDELLNSKHESSSLAGTAGTAASGVTQQQRPATSRGSMRRAAVVLADGRFDGGDGPGPDCA